MIEVGKVLTCVFIHISRLFEEAGAKEVVEDLSELRVCLQVLHVFLLDGVFDSAEISL